jgi:hypothetical protein
MSLGMSRQNVHYDKMLTNISVGYKNEELIHEKVLPTVMVSKQSDIYPVFGKEAFRVLDDRMAPGATAPELGFTWSQGSYFCEGHFSRFPIYWDVEANADEYINLRSTGTSLVTANILMNKESATASLVMNSSSYAAGNVATAPADFVKWSDYTNSDPIGDIQLAKEKVHKGQGVMLNKLVMSVQTFRILQRHTKLLNIYSSITPVTILGMDQIKFLLGVDEIIVGSALKSSASNPAQTDVLDYIWGSSVAFISVPKTAALMTPAFGYTFVWAGFMGGNGFGVRQYSDIERTVDFIEARHWYNNKIVSPGAGYLFVDAATALT